MTTPANPFDPRITPAREDIAADFLRGEVTAARFVAGRPMRLGVAHAPLRRAPAADAAIDTELLFGEPVRVYEEKAGWAWVQSEVDDYVGYVPDAVLVEPGPQPTHRVMTPGTHLYPRADIKSPPLRRLSLGAQLAVTARGERFAEVAWSGGAGFVPSRHLAPFGENAADFVAIAERFLHVPYLWAGRTGEGLDCSALVQLSLAAAGVVAPRDSDIQQAMLGEALPTALDLGALKRGDLIFWKGHVAIALDERRMIHANASAMAVSIDVAAEFAACVAPAEGPVTAIRRLRI